ncbi:2-C-methyl-D-erythritol 4-phosphate cytidylyltransferase [bacterium]|nr:2-C-methyl-D-erythritol 4-phosphate cytidylyltransferase [bacterium]
MNEGIKNYAIVLASGSGLRFGNKTPKQFAKIKEKTIFEHSIEVFEKCVGIDNIIVVINPDYYDYAQSIINTNNYKKVCRLLKGGQTRQESSFIGIKAIEDAEANVLIHDCARPLLSEEIIINCLNALAVHNAVAVGIPATDTIWEVDNGGFIKSIPDRKHYKLAQTPQCFKLSLIKKAHELASKNKNCTDDCSMVVNNKLDKIYIVGGDINNIKITYPKDLRFAEDILSDKI